jgi:hypothetical protein
MISNLLAGEFHDLVHRRRDARNARDWNCANTATVGMVALTRLPTIEALGAKSRDHQAGDVQAHAIESFGRASPLFRPPEFGRSDDHEFPQR